MKAIFNLLVLSDDLPMGPFLLSLWPLFVDTGDNIMYQPKHCKNIPSLSISCTYSFLSTCQTPNLSSRESDWDDEKWLIWLQKRTKDKTTSERNEHLIDSSKMIL